MVNKFEISECKKRFVHTTLCSNWNKIFDGTIYAILDETRASAVTTSHEAIHCGISVKVNVWR